MAIFEQFSLLVRTSVLHQGGARKWSARYCSVREGGVGLILIDAAVINHRCET